MNLLGTPVHYDPAAAVSKVTTGHIAMTAFDTTNARIAFTVPPSGKVRVRIVCVSHGATTFPVILLGILEGSTVRGRTACPAVSSQQGAQQIGRHELDTIITGLTPGASLTWDAAYGVETAVASSAIKYGGPDDTTTNNAFGGLIFQLYDAQPITAGAQLSVDANGRVDVIKVAGTAQTARDLGANLDVAVSTRASATDYTAGRAAKLDNIPAATAGASGGLLIAGSNAATTFASFTCTANFGIGGSLNLTGLLNIDNGIDVSCSTVNRPAITLAGNGGGEGLLVQGGATGNGATFVGGSSVGDGIEVRTTDGDAIDLNGIGGVGTVGIRGDITGTLSGNLTGNVGGNVIGQVASVAAPVTVGTNNDKTGYSLSSPQAFNLTGNITGNLTGSVGQCGSVTTAVTVGANNDKTGYSLSAAGVQAVWDALVSALTVVGSIGKRIVDFLDAAVSSRSTYAGADTAGTTTLLSRLTAGRAVLLDNLDTTVSSRSTYDGSDTAGTTTLLGRLTSGRADKLDFLDAAITSRLAIADYIAPDNSLLTWLVNVAEGDDFIDTTTTPWNRVITEKGTLVELIRKVLRDVDGNGITSETVVIGSAKES